jgi:mRNA interferase MazF
MSIQRGQIYFVNLNPVQGREQARQRPALVFSINEINTLPLVVTVIVGTKGANIRQNYATSSINSVKAGKHCLSRFYFPTTLMTT